MEEGLLTESSKYWPYTDMSFRRHKMRAFTLDRGPNNDDGTFGILSDEDMNPLFLTFEEGQRGNKRSISAIPAGLYKVRRFSSEKHPNSWQVLNVPGRDSILIHVINTEKDTEGCIGLGMEFGFMQAKDDQSGKVEKQPAILRSTEAIKKFNEILIGESEFTLTIR